MKRLLLTACIVGLAACGGSKDDIDTGYEDIIRENSQSLIYAFPINEQRELPTSSPVVLHFSSQIIDPAGANVVLKEQDGGEVAVTISAVENGKGLVITPVERLKPLTDYEVSVPAMALADGESKERMLRFTTRGLHEGPRTAVSRDTFTVERRFPDGANLPVADMSTLRLQMSQPIDRSTVKYGASGDSTVQLTDSNNNLVEAYVLVGDNYLSIDPKSDLIGGQSYTLSISPDLKSRQGESLPGSGLGNANFTWQFTPIDTRPPATAGNPDRARARMIQVIDDSNVDSPLTGKRVNLVPMYSVLLGPEGSSNPATPQASGYLAAELAHIPEHDETTPLRIDRGSLIVAGDLPVYIGGEVPAGFNSGKVNMEFLSDATGYMIENPYSDDAAAPKLVRLMMDMGISAEGDIANGSVTQTLMHIELVGTALVEDGVLTLNAVGVVEPNILGTERASAVLSFYMQGLDDQVNAPEPPVDESDIQLVSMTIGWDDQLQVDKTPFLKANEPIILNFSRAIDPDSIDATVSLTKVQGGTETAVPVSTYSDGAALVIKPGSLLESPTETGTPFTYRLLVQGNIQGLMGAAWSGVVDEVIERPTLTEVRQGYRRVNIATGAFGPQPSSEAVRKKSAFIMGVYPGYPCVLDGNTLDLPGNQAGRCQGGIHPHTVPVGKEDVAEPVDDIIPLATMPANRPIVVVTSTPLDPATVILGSTFQVHEVDEQGVALIAVEGALTINGDTLKFVPNKPWEKDKFYSYTLRSNGDMSSASADCNPASSDVMLCDAQGLPLNTQLLPELEIIYESRGAFDRPESASHSWLYETKSPAMRGGGPDLIQYFRAVEPSDTVLQMLRLTDNQDKNKNLIIEKTGDLGPFPYLGLSGGSQNAVWSYQRQEASDVDWQPDMGAVGRTDPYGVLLDPNGVASPPNSAKVISTNFGMRSLSQARQNFADEGKTFVTSASLYYGASVGCGYESFEQWEIQEPGCEINNLLPGGWGTPVIVPGQPLTAYCFYATPRECPKDKFTYIHGILFAEVTEQVDAAQQAVIVQIYPGHMVTTAFDIYLKNFSQRIQDLSGGSGYQVMRMRYKSDGQLIPGYIATENNVPIMHTDVDLYLDAPYLTTNFLEQGIASAISHNQRSYPVNMKLSGPVQFLEDGRMVVEQYNENAVPVKLRSNVPPIFIDLEVPRHGSYLRYISEPVKN